MSRENLPHSDLIDRHMSTHPLFCALGLEFELHGDGVAATAKLSSLFACGGDAKLTHEGQFGVVLDTVLGAAVIFRTGAKHPIATINLRLDHLASAQIKDEIRCRARCYAVRGSVAFAEAELSLVKTDAPVARALASFMVGTAGPGINASAKAQGAANGAQARASANNASTIFDWLSFEVADNEAGKRIYSCKPDGSHIGNPLIEALHGGVLATFLELAAGHELSLLPGRRPENAILTSVNVDYLQAVSLSPTFAKALILRTGRRTSVVRVESWQQSEERLVAVAECTFVHSPGDASIV